MLKRVLTLIAIVFAMSGLALAQTTLIDTQTGASAAGAPHSTINWLYASQAHNGLTGAPYGPLTINLTQTSTTSYNDADLRQKGAGLTTTVVQIATAENVAITEQGTPGHSGYYGYAL